MARLDISKVLSDEGATLEARLDRLEATMANGDKKITECFDSVKTLEGAMKIALDGVKEDFSRMVDSLREEIDNLRVVNEDLKAKIPVLKRAVANEGPSQREISKLQIPEPKPFNGTRDVKVLENFIWQMEQYFKASKMEDEDEKDKRLGKVSYQLQLPAWLKIHLVFHISCLKPYYKDVEDLTRGVSQRGPATLMPSFEKEVESILEKRVTNKEGAPIQKEYLIKWK
ncbi:hypothetical protein NE237_012374 [Protea cynaroides]|uniref:Tf2-1-like SH3-like domain-containing protein n=1 Tax=Protea cynaroides TaxID=273540 RepID=A0A9Q0JXK0_9MAGN|nr:hypothetical protein NE237_012374 [Protea cynaroides]